MYAVNKNQLCNLYGPYPYSAALDVLHHQRTEETLDAIPWYSGSTAPKNAVVKR